MNGLLHILRIGGLSERFGRDSEEPGGAFAPGLAFHVLQRCDEPCRPGVRDATRCGNSVSDSHGIGMMKDRFWLAVVVADKDVQLDGVAADVHDGKRLAGSRHRTLLDLPAVCCLIEPGPRLLPLGHAGRYHQRPSLVEWIVHVVVVSGPSDVVGV